MEIKRYKWTEILSLIVFTIITIIALQKGDISMFYLIFVFWMDEFVKTIFDAINYFFNRNNIALPIIYKRQFSVRFFLLFIYILFIIVFFCFMIDWGSEDTVIENLLILFFKNTLFNLCVFGFVLREFIHFLSYKNNFQLPAHTLMSKGLFTLHISIIFGVFIWAFLSGKITGKSIDLGIYQTLVVILPFLLIKLYFEILEIKTRFSKLKKLN